MLKVTTVTALVGFATSVSAQELLRDPGFDLGGTEWGKFGNADFNNFFGNPHSSFFADNPSNSGGVFQLGIAHGDDLQYTFQLTNVRIEENFNANFRFGLEFWDASDTNKLGEIFETIDTNVSRDGLTTGDGLSFSMSAESINGAAFVRPIILFDSPDPASGSQANAFVFSASLTAIPAPATAAGLVVFAAGRRRRS